MDRLSMFHHVVQAPQTKAALTKEHVHQPVKFDPAVHLEGQHQLQRTWERLMATGQSKLSEGEEELLTEVYKMAGVMSIDTRPRGLAKDVDPRYILLDQDRFGRDRVVQRMAPKFDEDDNYTPIYNYFTESAVLVELSVGYSSPLWHVAVFTSIYISYKSR